MREKTSELTATIKTLQKEIAGQDQLASQLASRMQIINSTELNANEAVRQASERRIAGIIDSAMDAIISIDVTRCIILFNPAAEKVFGYSAAEIMGQPIDRLIPMRFHEAHHHHIENFSTTKTSKRSMGKLGAIYGIRSNGEEFPIEASISQVEANDEKIYTVILRDITEKKKMEMQFLRAQRMESIGTLAGGIAHDLNNILSPILMSVQMLQLRVTDESSQRMLEVLRLSAERGGELVKQILSFARGVAGERVELQPRHLLQETVKILKETLPKSIRVALQLDPELPLVSGNATQLQQVLMNLCINARDAMPNGGTLSIEAKIVVIDDTYAEMLPGATVGNFIQIMVTDTGTGIAPEHLSRIFDPFFTTKEIGKGTGLGLATVATIIKSHEGFVNVYSEIGRGTKFSFYLPALTTDDPTPPVKISPALPPGNGELILVVDDESAIRQIAQTILENFNYRVLTANDGAEAIAKFTEYQNEISVVVTDIVMPVMDGAAFIRAIRAIRPQTKIIVSSGFAETNKLDEAAAIGIKDFLTKPYSTQALLETLARLLSE